MLSFLLIAISLCLTAWEWPVSHNSSLSSENTKTSSPSFGTVWGWRDTWIWMQGVRLGWWTCQGHGQYYYRGSTKQYRTTTRQIQDNFQRHAARVLSSLGFSLTLEVILETTDLSSALNLGTDEMLRSNLHVLDADREAEWRNSMRKWKGWPRCHWKPKFP